MLTNCVGSESEEKSSETSLRNRGGTESGHYKRPCCHRNLSSNPENQKSFGKLLRKRCKETIGVIFGSVAIMHGTSCRALTKT
jgi:hypothetical protein